MTTPTSSAIPTKPTYPHEVLFDLPFFNGTLDEAAEFVKQQIQSGKPTFIATPNPEQIVLASEDQKLKEAWKQFNFFIPDGSKLLWAAKKRGKPLQRRITGVDLLTEFLHVMAEYGAQGVIVGSTFFPQDMVTSRKERFVELEIDKARLWWLEDFSKQSAADSNKILKLIREKEPVFVFVALGAPDQELWVAQHSQELTDAGVKCVMVVGGAFDMLTGKVKRAPLILRNLGLEWLWRLILQPWRIQRQLKLVKFVNLVRRLDG